MILENIYPFTDSIFKHYFSKKDGQRREITATRKNHPLVSQYCTLHRK